MFKIIMAALCIGAAVTAIAPVAVGAGVFWAVLGTGIACKVYFSLRNRKAAAITTDQTAE